MTMCVMGISMTKASMNVLQLLVLFTRIYFPTSGLLPFGAMHRHIRVSHSSPQIVTGHAKSIFGKAVMRARCRSANHASISFTLWCMFQFRLETWKSFAQIIISYWIALHYIKFARAEFNLAFRHPRQHTLFLVTYSKTPNCKKPLP